MEITFKAVMEKFSQVPKQYNMFGAKADSWSFCQQIIILALKGGQVYRFQLQKSQGKRT